VSVDNTLQMIGTSHHVLLVHPVSTRGHFDAHSIIYTTSHSSLEYGKNWHCAYQ